MPQASQQQFPYRRTIVFGRRGAGKTTLARRISDQFAVPFFEMDDLYCRATQSDNTHETLTALAGDVISGDSWIFAGSYPEIQAMTWLRAEAIIWLDYSGWVLIRRMVRRRLQRFLADRRAKQAGLPVRQPPRGRGTAFLRAIVGYSSRSKTHFRELYDVSHRHLHVIRLRDERETRRWLALLAVGQALHQ